MALPPINFDKDPLLDLKLNWLFIADGYRNAGDHLRSYEVAKELFTLLGENAKLEVLAERYEFHLAEWKRVSEEDNVSR